MQRYILYVMIAMEKRFYKMDYFINSVETSCCKLYINAGKYNRRMEDDM